MDNIFFSPPIKILFFMVVVAIGVAFFSIALAAAILFALFLFSLTMAVFLKFKVYTKELIILLLIGFTIHAALLGFIYFSGFSPVGGGADYQGYHLMASEFAHRMWTGDFSLDGVRGGHDFTLLVGVAYFLFYPDILVGNVLIIWFFCLSLVFSYLIITEMGASGKVAFLAGILVLLYPSYLYFSSLLLKDNLIIPLALFALLVCVKMLKEFSWPKFLLFFVILTPLIHLRFYIGYALMFGFLASWFLVSNNKEKLRYGFPILFLLGFSPLILGNGYYGMGVLKEFITPEQITIYREIAYNPDSPNNENINPILPGQPIPAPKNQNNVAPAPVPSTQPDSPQPVASSGSVAVPAPLEPVPSGLGSSFVVETGLGHGPVAFIKNSFLSFTYGSLGPLPWQLRYKRQQMALFETIPWYIILMTFGYSLFKSIQEKNTINLLRQKKFVIVLMLFGVLAMAGMSLFINNYGILMRIRIPVFISFIIAGCVIFNNYLEAYIEKIYEKISRYRRSGVYRV